MYTQSRRALATKSNIKLGSTKASHCSLLSADKRGPLTRHLSDHCMGLILSVSICKNRLLLPSRVLTCKEERPKSTQSRGPLGTAQILLTTFSKGAAPNTLKTGLGLEGEMQSTIACCPTRVVYSSNVALSFLNRTETKGYCDRGCMPQWKRSKLPVGGDNFDRTCSEI